MTHVDLEYALGDELLRHLALDEAELDTELGHGSMRSIRSRLENVENQLSYVRRVAQSRVDLARSEKRQRVAGKSRSDLSDVIRRLPEVLSENTKPSTRMSRFADFEIDPEPEYMVDVDSVVPPMRILEIGQLDSSELREVIVRLESIEARTSIQRRIVQERLDKVHVVIASRYGSSVG